MLSRTELRESGVDESQAELERLTEVFINLCAVQKLGQETRDPSTSRRMAPIPRNKGRRNKTLQAENRRAGEVSSKQKEIDEKPVSNFLVAFFLFVVVGSAFLQIFRLFLDMEVEDSAMPPE